MSKFIGLFCKKLGVTEWGLRTTYEDSGEVTKATRSRAEQGMDMWQRCEPLTDMRLVDMEGTTCNLAKATGWPK